jgi:hypothetical protein
MSTIESDEIGDTSYFDSYQNIMKPKNLQEELKTQEELFDKIKN